MTVKSLREILTPRQFEMAVLVAAGWNNRMCGAEMGISEQSAKNYLRDIFDRVGVWSRLELACRYAWEWKAGLYPGAPHPLERHKKVAPRKGWIANPRGINRFTKPDACPPAVIAESLPMQLIASI
jgi:DNA-binding CsgD family transcriptional regulator